MRVHTPSSSPRHHATVTPGALAARPTRRHGMTMLEVVITIFLMGMLLAFAIPRLTGADVAGADQQAKTTASGVADTVARLYATQIAANPYDTTAWTQARDAMAASLLAPDTLDDTEAATQVRRVPARPDVRPETIEHANPDIEVTGNTDADPSTGAGDASVAAYLVDSGAGTNSRTPYWLVGIAVYTPTDGGGACWMLQQALNPPAPVATETYLVRFWAGENATAQQRCTGHVAARLDLAAVRTDPVNSDSDLFDDATAPAGPTVALDRGSVWNQPLQVTDALVDAAHTRP